MTHTLLRSLPVMRSAFSLIRSLDMFALVLAVGSLVLAANAHADEILMRNDFVTCYSDRLVVHFYYFPFGEKTIRYDDIQSYELRRLDQMNFLQVKCWGMAMSPIWWHLDIRREWREHFLLVDAGQWPKIGITMDDKDIAKVYDLIKHRMASRV